MPAQVCRHCGVDIFWMDSISQWWHITGESHTHAYRGCRDAAGNLTGATLAEPELAA